MEEANDDIPMTAMSIVNENMNQRERLLQNVHQIQLLVSDEDVAMYQKLRFYKERLEALVCRLNIEEFTFLIYQMG